MFPRNNIFLISVILMMQSIGLPLIAQVSLYSFSENAATYTAITGTVIHASGWNDPAPVTVPIPFTFTFNSVGYTSCSVNGNGYITFGSSVSVATSATPISSATGYAGAVSAMGIDLISNSSTVQYTTTGTSPNRVFIVQWSNCRRVADNNSGADWNFQIRLLETSNIIQVRYGACGATNATNTIVSEIGLRGAANTDFNNRRKTTASSWAGTTTAGTLNTHTVLSRATALPPSGRTFIWSPPLAVSACDPAGNVLLYSNYDGGVLNINIDQNVPNIKIGICTYEGVTVNISGAFVANVTEVRYVGYNAGNAHCSGIINTSINGVPSATTSVSFYPAATMSDPNGSSNMVCGYSCGTGNQGGCNTAGQIAHYFLTQFGGTMRYHYTQYGCWSGTYLMSAGGNCCLVNQVLPVELNYFSVSCGDNGRADLQWETASEINNHFFTVERSNDGFTFYPVARIEGSGTTSQPVRYVFSDSEELLSVVYYRLRQTDYNGQTEVFPIRGLNRNNCNSYVQSPAVFPNPVRQSVVLQLYSADENNGVVTISDNAGRIVYIQHRLFEKGENVVVLDVADFSPGAYFVSVEGENGWRLKPSRLIKE